MASLAVLGAPGLAGFVAAQDVPEKCLVVGDCPGGSDPACSPEDSACNGGPVCAFSTPQEAAFCTGSGSDLPDPFLLEAWAPGVSGIMVGATPPGTAVPLGHSSRVAGSGTRQYLQYACSFTISQNTHACWTQQGKQISTDNHGFAWCAQKEGDPCMDTTTPTSGSKDMYPNGDYNTRVLWCVNLVNGVPQQTCTADWKNITWIAINDTKDWAKGWAKGWTQGWTT